MKWKYLLVLITLLHTTAVYCQSKKAVPPKGSLFIIGGGDRTQALLQAMISTAKLQPTDYIIILPMSGENPDTSFYYISEDIAKVCSNKIVNFNFTKDKTSYTNWLDSLQHAKLVFITGGDQNRFMQLVLHTPIYTAIHKAFGAGATIAGTSAGAAMMSKVMITGGELLGDSIGSGPFTKIQYNMVEVKEGLGLIKTAIIDQHFIVRSRYNRLLSVLAAYPQLEGIGVDESTAIIVQGKKITVTGESQVVRMRLTKKQKKQSANTTKIKLHQVQVDVLVAGDTFIIP
jgi:cyanophycinase